uniref:Integrase catalytic domain-containing protein n=1 Tax=Trichuris muris TaxID=70415 RepID=A0A5S6QQU2_TRIMR
MPTVTPSGNRYMLTLIDDYSRFTVVRLVKSKDEVTSAIKEYVAKMKNRFGKKPIAFRTDNGKEYVGLELKKYFREEGIEHQRTVPYTPQQNGVAERKNRSLTEMAKCMLLDAGLHNRFWGEAVRSAAYLQNRMPSRSIDKTPYELFFGRKPELGHVRVFGSKVFCFVPKQRRRKWDDKAVEGVLIGYDDATKGYRILDPKTDGIWISRSVRIVEKAEPKECATALEPEGELERGRMISQPITNTRPNLNRTEEEEEEEVVEEEEEDIGITAPKQESDVEENRNPSKDEGLVHSATINPVRCSQRTNKGIPPKKLCYRVEAPMKREPSSWDEMVRLPAEEKKKWISAAEEEIKSLKDYKVWELVDLPQGKKTITSKWVFKMKPDSQGRAHTYKARLVARGFSQKYGLDYDETFAPVVRHETVRVLFTVAAARRLHVRHLDVKCAYLNGELEEEIYMEQPQGFVVPGKESKVLRLKKSIYGLKQSARCWNRKATEALSKLGFTQGQADQCLFTRKEENNEITYVLLYVDDLLVIASSEKATRKVGEQLNAHFYTRDLGGVVQYLGIEVERECDGSFLLCQKGKIAEMLEEHGMLEPKPATTPMEVGYLNSLLDKSKGLPNNRRFRQAIGSLLYLATVSRPDIAMAVGLLCRCVETPTERDWKSVKRVMRYLATTINQKLRLSGDSEMKLQCYVDAEWAGDKTDRKSTSGYLFKLGDSVVAWSSQKQSTVALSSTEAEYIAASHACKELLWLRQLLTDMCIPQVTPTTVYEDNQGCIRLLDSNHCGARTKHIDVRHHQLRSLREQGIISIEYCPTENMTADIFTKPLGKERFRKFVEQLGLQYCKQGSVT